MQTPEVSAECVDMIKRMLVADPEKRITMHEIKKHPFFLSGLPDGALDMNDTLFQQRPFSDAPVSTIFLLLPCIGTEAIDHHLRKCLQWSYLIDCAARPKTTEGYKFYLLTFELSISEKAVLAVATPHTCCSFGRTTRDESAAL